MRLYLVRHARTLPTGPDSREWPLSTDGMAEARQLAEAGFWADIDVLYSSPEPKALATVRPAAEQHALQIHEDDRLREIGRPTEWLDDYEAAVELYLEEPDTTPQGWEPVDEARARLEGLVRELEQRHPGQRVALCGHGLALTLYLSTLEGVLGRPFAVWRALGFGQVAVAEEGRLLLPFGEPSEAGLRVRRAEPDDFEAVSALLAELGRPPLMEETRGVVLEIFTRHVSAPAVESYVVTRDGQPVGFLSMHLRERLNFPTLEAWVPDFIVTEAEHGSGAARLLFSRAVEIAREKGCHRLVLESGHTRKRAHRFYEREGMTHTGKVYVMQLG